MATLQELASLHRSPEKLKSLSKEELLRLSSDLYKHSRDAAKTGPAKIIKENYEMVANLVAGDVARERDHDEQFVSDIFKRHFRNQRYLISHHLSLNDIFSSKPVSFDSLPEKNYQGLLSDKLVLVLNKLKQDSAISNKSKLDFLNQLRYESESADFQQQLAHTPPELLEKYGRTTQDRFNYLTNVLEKDLLKGSGEGKMKVLRVSHDYNRNTGGLQEHLQELNTALGKKQDVELHQVLPISQKEFNSLVSAGKIQKSNGNFIDKVSGAQIHPIFLNYKDGERMVRLNDPDMEREYDPQMLKIFEEINPDILHVHNGYYKTHRTIAQIANAKGTGVIHTWHGGKILGKGGEGSNDGSRRRQKIHDDVAKIADYNACISEVGRSAFKNPKGVEIAYGVNLDKFNPKDVSQAQRVAMKKQLGMSEGDFVFFFPGRYHEQKNQYELLRAFADVATKDPHAKLVLAGQKFDDKGGSEYLKKLNQFIRQKNLQNSVYMLDRVESKEDMRKLYAMSDAVVYPSKNEGRGRSLIEAMAMGKPVLASNDAGLKDSIRQPDGDKGLLFNPDSLDQIVGALNRVKDDNALRTDLSHKARKYALDNLSIGAYANKYHNIYKRVLAKKKK
ncbi:glycosyltransferase family 4 protein [archaeon]|nr:glycosyltransferase family 4 protein [archaeon]MBL7057340.1 glycosyltransferase family 4 protein [Candidatus Woesearchaeota archaeon]